MTGYREIGPEPVPVGLNPLFEARWSYEEFQRVMPFGPDSEGQAYAFSKPARVDGVRLSGTYRLTQFPRWRVDGVLLPDVHGLIETQSGAQVATKAGGLSLVSRTRGIGGVAGREGAVCVGDCMRGG